MLMVCFHVLELLFDESAMPIGMEVRYMTMGFIYGPVNVIHGKKKSRKIVFTHPHVLLKYSAIFFPSTKDKISTKNVPKHHKRSAAIINDYNLTMVGFLCCRTLTWGLPHSQCSVLWELQCRWSSSCISWSPLSSASTALHSSPVCCHMHRTLPSHRYRDLLYSS